MADKLTPLRRLCFECAALFSFKDPKRPKQKLICWPTDLKFSSHWILLGSSKIHGFELNSENEKFGSIAFFQFYSIFQQIKTRCEFLHFKKNGIKQKPHTSWPCPKKITLHPLQNFSFVSWLANDSSRTNFLLLFSSIGSCQLFSTRILTVKCEKCIAVRKMCSHKHRDGISSSKWLQRCMHSQNGKTTKYQKKTKEKKTRQQTAKSENQQPQADIL